MRNRFFVLVASVALLFTCAGGAALAEEEVFPQVTLIYNAGASTYTYHVLVPANNTYTFGLLDIYALATGWDENGENQLWTLSGPWVGGDDQMWSNELIWNYGFGGDTPEWCGLSGKEVLYGPWEGDFIVIAPNTSPVPGQGMTMDTVGDSVHPFDIGVPGPVPEPSSLVALGSLVTLSGALIRRRYC